MAKQGGKQPGAGRPKGSVNKATADVRAAIATLAEQNVSKLQGWLDRIAVTDPARAADIFVRMLEYHIPKLARTEIRAEDELGITVRVVDLTGVKKGSDVPT